MSNFKSCTHIKVTGVRCGSPALRGEQFCYFHQRMLRTVKGPPYSRVHHAALLEDEESIQASLIEIVNGLLRGSIELKRAELILRALNTAVRNIRRVHFGIHSRDMVKEIPTYPAVPDPEVEEAARVEAARQAGRAEIARIRAEDLAAYHAAQNKVSANAAPANATPPAPTPVRIATHARTTQARVGTDAFVRPVPVGTAAPGCPGPEVPGRITVASKPAPTPPAEVAKRKPPLGVKAEAPKQRKIAAHSLP